MAGLRGTRWLTWANFLTSMRLFAAFPLYYSIATGAWGIACLLFWMAVATDWVDGRVARARGESSAFGGLFDHGSDAIFVISGLLALSKSGQTPPLLPYFVGAAFLQYVLDSKTLAGLPLRASAIGRWNGILYFVPIGIIVTRENLSLSIPTDGWVHWLGSALVVSTVVSMSARVWALITSRGLVRKPSP
jgi:phosphatidylglycerophosphate synthase